MGVKAFVNQPLCADVRVAGCHVAAPPAGSSPSKPCLHTLFLAKPPSAKLIPVLDPLTHFPCYTWASPL